MGEYARAAIWAEMRGMEFSDMGPEDWMEFYDEDDEGDMASSVERIACPKCGKMVKGQSALRQHTKAKHGGGKP